jgi:hypothetical protein
MRKARGGGKGYEKISRDSLQLKSLTLKARGLMALLQSLPDDWECSGVKGIVEQFCEHDGYHAVNEAVKELEAHGLFARLKRQGQGGKWDWLWTYSDDPSEVANDVRRWEAEGFRVSTNLAGNKDPVRRSARGTRTMFEELQHGDSPEGDAAVLQKSEHGTMFEKSVDGSPVDGEPPNKESLLPPSEVETSTGQINTHTARTRGAAPPQCVPDEPLPAEFNDPVIDPDRAAADWGAQRPRSSTRVTGRWNRTAHSPAALALVSAYCAERPLPTATRERLLPEVSKLLTQGFPEWAITEGITVCFASGLGPTLLPDKVAAVMHRGAAPAARVATSDQRMNDIDALLARRAAARVADPLSFVSATPLEIEAPE